MKVHDGRLRKVQKWGWQGRFWPVEAGRLKRAKDHPMNSVLSFKVAYIPNVFVELLFCIKNVGVPAKFHEGGEIGNGL